MANEFHDRIDAFDLVITALKDHEKKLDELVEQLASLIESLATQTVTEKEKPIISSKAVKAPPTVVCSHWQEFRERCPNAAIVAFEIQDTAFHVYALVDDIVFHYVEALPRKWLKVVERKSSFTIDKASLDNIDVLQFLIEGKLRCGLTLPIQSIRTTLAEHQFQFELSYPLDPTTVKLFLSEELDIAEGKIVEGKITG